jgi:hypothetical protein
VVTVELEDPHPISYFTGPGDTSSRLGHFLFGDSLSVLSWGATDFLFVAKQSQEASLYLEKPTKYIHEYDLSPSNPEE